MADINIYGKFHAATSEHILAEANEIKYDDEQTLKEKIEGEEDSINDNASAAQKSKLYAMNVNQSAAHPRDARITFHDALVVDKADTGNEVVVPYTMYKWADGKPTTKITVACKARYKDSSGNSWDYDCVMGLQGNSTVYLDKKNIAFSLVERSITYYEEEGDLKGMVKSWTDGDSIDVAFGDWIARDTYHLKAHANDITMSRNWAAYDIAKQIFASRGFGQECAWKQALLPYGLSLDENDIYRSRKKTIDWEAGEDESSLELEDQLDTNATCQPDAFPCEVYINNGTEDVYWGLFMLAQNKFRKNYHQKKKAKQGDIHLDGLINYNSMWGTSDGLPILTYSGGIGVSIKTPTEGLRGEDGSDYDYDVPNGLSGVYSYSKEVKEAITWLANIFLNKQKLDGIPEGGIYTLYNAYRLDRTKTAELAEVRKFCEKVFNMDNIIDYIICMILEGNTDGFANNWQWLSWRDRSVDVITEANAKERKWYICPYDLDQSWGGSAASMTDKDVSVYDPSGTWTINPIGIVTCVFKKDIRDRWNELYSNGIINSKNIIDTFELRLKELRYDRMEKDKDAWPYLPCNRDSGINEDYWELATGYIGGYAELYHYTKNSLVCITFIYYDEGVRKIEKHFFKALEGDYHDKPNIGKISVDNTNRKITYSEEWWEELDSSDLFYDKTKTYTKGDSVYVPGWGCETFSTNGSQYSGFYELKYINETAGSGHQPLFCTYETAYDFTTNPPTALSPEITGKTYQRMSEDGVANFDTKTANAYPRIGGVKDSWWRCKNFIQKYIEEANTYINGTFWTRTTELENKDKDYSYKNQEE